MAPSHWKTSQPSLLAREQAGSRIRGGTAGFTFLELAVVVVIMGVMAAITLPRFSGTFSRVTLGGTARGLAGTMGYIRDAAARHGRTYFLNIDFDRKRYFVTHINEEIDLSEIPYLETDFLDEEIYTQYADMVVSERQLQKKISFWRVIFEDGTEAFEGVARIEFRPNGTADEAVIQITNPKERIYSVHLERYNGQATVYNYEYIPPPPPVLTERERPSDTRSAL